MKKYDYKGRTALVTGASTGIGKSFAHALPERGVSRLILAARTESALDRVANDIRRTHGIAVDVIPCDLSEPGADRSVADRLETLGAQVDVLINNAGFATYGRFDATLDIDEAHNEIQLNCGTLVGLTARLLPGMQERDTGVIVNISSTAAFQPVPYMAVYGATKSFVLSFSEALWAENKDSGVRILGLCPGATETPFFDRVDAEEASLGSRQMPETVVELGLSSVDKGRPSVISGRRNALLANAGRLLPRRQVAVVAERTMRPKEKVDSSATVAS